MGELRQGHYLFSTIWLLFYYIHVFSHYISVVTYVNTLHFLEYRLLYKPKCIILIKYVSYNE